MKLLQKKMFKTQTLKNKIPKKENQLKKYKINQKRRKDKHKK